MNRRKFLQWQAKTICYLTAGAPLLSAAGFFRPHKAMADGLPDIAVANGAPAAAARAAVDAIGGMSRFVKPGQSVVIKPNMSFAHGPENATNTHPEVVREVLLMVKEAGAGRVRVLDHSLHNPEQSLERSGILAACNSVEEGICHHLMTQGFYRQESIPGAKDMRENSFMRDVLDADVIIAVPVAKSHSGTGVSLSLKGQMGLIWDRRIMHSRYNLNTSIVDMNLKVKPHLAIIDATRVLTTGGPGGPGKVITPGEVIASADPVAADAMAVASYEWYGRRMQPHQVPHIQQAHERGLGRMDIENLRVQRLKV
jgi:uncharacterized protein (DUF362 family)